MFDSTISVGNLIQIAFYVGGFIGLMFVMRRDIGNMAEELKIMKQELKTLTQILIAQGRQDERITALTQTVISQGRRLDDAIRRQTEDDEN